jgi:tetratricopeptide (TPR) repeat protein
LEWAGLIDRRQSRWHHAMRNFERAMELDPRNVKILTTAAVTYGLLRDYKQARETIDRVIAINPDASNAKLFRAGIDFKELADIRRLHAEMERALPEFPALRGANMFFLALLERDAVAADRALALLAVSPEVKSLNYFFPARGIGEMTFSLAYAKGLIAQMKGDAAAAQVAFTVARVQQEEAVRAQPDHGSALCVLGLIDAGLGRREDALREARRALDLAPIAKDSLNGADVLYFYAVICAWTGKHDLAIEQLQTLAKVPAGVTYGDLRLNPHWDPLRGDPRFEKLLQEAKQPLALN